MTPNPTIPTLDARLSNPKVLFLWKGLLFGILLLPFAGWCQPKGMPLFSVRVAPAEKVRLTPTLEFPGSIEPWRTIDLSTQVEGLVQSIPIEEGQRLRQKDLVCQLDREKILISVSRHEAMVRSASAELRRLETGFQPEEIEEALKNVEAAKARQERAAVEWERFRPLVEQGVSTRNEGTKMESTYFEAEAQLRAAEARLRLLKRGYRYEQILKARAQLDIEKADLAEVHRQLACHTLLAPTDCVVIHRYAEPGEWVDHGQAFAQVAVLNPLRVRIEVPQVYFNRVRPGQEATLKVDGEGDKTFEAWVQQVVPSVGKGTRNFPVLMRLDNPDYSLAGGLFARVRLQVGEEGDHIVVPREAVQVRGDKLVVLVADPLSDGAPPSASDPSHKEPRESPASPAPGPDVKIRVVEVKPGNDVGDQVAIETIPEGAIEPGQEVVVLGGTRLQNGMPARVIRDQNQNSILGEAGLGDKQAE